MQSISCRRKRAEEASHARLQHYSFVTAGGVSVEDRSKRPETVRPQVGERCEDNQSATARWVLKVLRTTLS